MGDICKDLLRYFVKSGKEKTSEESALYEFMMSVWLPRFWEIRKRKHGNKGKRAKGKKYIKEQTSKILKTKSKEDPYFILRLFPIFCFFATWEQMQVSACMGGPWDKGNEDLGISESQMKSFRDFVLGHDYDKDNHKKPFSERNEKLVPLRDEIKSLLQSTTY